MVSSGVTRVLEETRQLSQEGRKQLLALLSADDADSMTGDVELDELLIRKGIMSASPAIATAEDAARAEAWRPIAIQGKPLSKTIIEDRR